MPVVFFLPRIQKIKNKSLRKRRTKKKHPDRAGHHIAMAVLCIAGGGMKAITWLIAVFVSLIQDTEHDDIKNAHDVLRFVTVLSTVSAGSWFVMSLMYSDVFLNLLGDMGRVTCASEAKAIFMQRWILPLRALLKKRSTDAGLKPLSHRHRFLLATMKHTMGPDAAHLATALSGDITWSQVLLEAIHRVTLQ